MADDEWSEPLVVDRATGQALWPDLRGRRPNAAPGQDSAGGGASYIMMQSYTSAQPPAEAGYAQAPASQLHRDVSNDQRLRRTVSACARADPAVVTDLRAGFNVGLGMMDRPRSEALPPELQLGLGPTGATGAHAGSAAPAGFSSASGHMTMGPGQPSAYAAHVEAGGADWPSEGSQAQRLRAHHYNMYLGYEATGSATPLHGGSGGGLAGMDTASTPPPYGGAAGDQSMAPSGAAANTASPGPASADAARHAEADAFHNAFGARLPRLAVIHAAGGSFGGGAGSSGGAYAANDWGSGSPLRRVWASSLHEAGGSTGGTGRPSAGPNSPSARAAGSPIAVRGTPTKHVAGSQGGSILSPRGGPLSAGSPGFAAASAQLAHLGLGSGPGSGSAGASRHLRSSSGGGGLGGIAAACLSPQFGATASAGGGGNASSTSSEQRRLALSSVSNLAQLRETVAADGALPPREKQNLLQLIEGAMAEQQQSQQLLQTRDAAGSSASGSGEAPYSNQGAGMTLQQLQMLTQAQPRSQSTPSGPMSAPYGLARPQQQPSPPPRPAGPHRLSLDAASRAAAVTTAATATGRLQSMPTPFGGATSVAATAASAGVGVAPGGSQPSDPGLCGISGSGALSVSSGSVPASGPMSGGPPAPGGVAGAPAGFGRQSFGMDTSRSQAASLSLPESMGSMGRGAGGILSGGGGYGAAMHGVGLASSISAASGSRLRRCSGGLSPPPHTAFTEIPGLSGGHVHGHQQLHQQQYHLQQQQQQQQQHAKTEDPQQQHAKQEDQQQLLREVYTAFAGDAAQREEHQQHQQPYPMRTSAGGGDGSGTGLIMPSRLDSNQSSRSLLTPGGNRVATSGGSGSGSGSGGASSGGAAPHGMEGVLHHGVCGGDGVTAAVGADTAAGAGNAAGRATSGSRSGSEGPRAPRPSRAAGSEGGSQISSATGCSGEPASVAGVVGAMHVQPGPPPSSAAATPEGPRSAAGESMLPHSAQNPATAPWPETAAMGPAAVGRPQQLAMDADHMAALPRSHSPRALPSPSWQAAPPPRPASAIASRASYNDLPRLLPQQQQELQPQQQQQQQELQPQQQQQALQPGAAAVLHGVSVSPLARQMLAMPFDVSGRSGQANSTGSGGGGAGAGGGGGSAVTGLLPMDVRARMLAGASMPALLPSYQQQQHQSRLQPRPPPNFASGSSGWVPELHGGDAAAPAHADTSTWAARNDSVAEFPSLSHPPTNGSGGGLGGRGGGPDVPQLLDSPQHRHLQQQLQQSRFHRSHQQLLVSSGPASSTGELTAAAAAQPAWHHMDARAHAPYVDDAGGSSLSSRSRPASSTFGGAGGGLPGTGFAANVRAGAPPGYNTEPGFPQSPLPHHPASTPQSGFGFSSPHSRPQQQQQQEQQHQQQRPSGYSTPTMQAATAQQGSLQQPGATAAAAFGSPGVFTGQQQQPQERQWQVPREMQRAAAAAAAAAAQARAQALAQVAHGFTGARLSGSVADLGPAPPPLQAFEEAMASEPGRAPVAGRGGTAAVAGVAGADQDGDLLMLGGLGVAGGDDGHTGLLRDMWNTTGGAAAPIAAPGGVGSSAAAAGGGPPRAASGDGALLSPLPPMLEDGDVDALDCMLDELLGVGDMGDVVGPGSGGDGDEDMDNLHLHFSALQDGSGGRRAAVRRGSSGGRRAGEGAAGAAGPAGADPVVQQQSQLRAGGPAAGAEAGAGGLGGLGGSFGHLAARGSSEMMGVVELGADGGGGSEVDILALGLGDGTDTDMGFMSGF